MIFFIVRITTYSPSAGKCIQLKKRAAWPDVEGKMPKKIAAVAILLALCQVDAAELPKRVLIDERSPVRTVCRLEFAPIKGLLVEAKLAPASAYQSRVNNDRYAACPYDLEMKYGGLVMRIDFGSSFDLESVKNYRHSMPVDSGFFVYDGQEWKGESDPVTNADGSIMVTEVDGLMTVVGMVDRRDPNSGRKDYCYAVTLVHGSGFATGGMCSARKESLKPWQQLFSIGSVISYQPSR